MTSSRTSSIESRASVAGLVLAAGASRRLGTPKALLAGPDGVPRVRQVAMELLEAGCTPVLVVTGALSNGAHGTPAAVPEAIMTAVADLPVICVANPRSADGMGTSIAAGIEVLLATTSPPHSPDEAADGRPPVSAVLIAPCDMPLVSTSHYTALLERTPKTQNPPTLDSTRLASRYVVNPHADAPGNEAVIGIPAILPRSDWPSLRQLSGDTGARDLLRAPGTLTVFVRSPHFDLDAPDDVRRWRDAKPFRSPSSSPVPAMASTILETALADLEPEFAQTRRMLERIPVDHLDFQPHAKSWPLKKLARHVCDFPEWTTVTVQTTWLDFDAPMPPREIPTTVEGFLKIWDDSIAAMRAVLPSITDEDLAVNWEGRVGGQAVISMPRAAILRSMVLSHMIHHRAQLTIYYRLVGVPVPGMYGPSADET